MKSKSKDEVLRRLQNIELLLEQRKTKPLNLVEAAKYLSISQSHLYRLTSQRKIISHKPNGKYLYFFKEELDEWVREAQSSKEKDKSEKDASTPSASADRLSTGDEEDEPP